MHICDEGGTVVCLCALALLIGAHPSLWRIAVRRRLKPCLEPCRVASRPLFHYRRRWGRRVQPRYGQPRPLTSRVTAPPAKPSHSGASARPIKPTRSLMTSTAFTGRVDARRLEQPKATLIPVGAEGVAAAARVADLEDEAIPPPADTPRHLSTGHSAAAVGSVARRCLSPSHCHCYFRRRCYGCGRWHCHRRCRHSRCRRRNRRHRRDFRHGSL